MRVIVQALDPRSNAGEPIQTKDGRVKVAEIALELGELTIRHLALWFREKGQEFSVEFPGTGYGRVPVSGGKYVEATLPDGSKILHWQDGDGTVLSKVRELAVKAYGDARDARKAAANAPRLVQGQK